MVASIKSAQPARMLATLLLLSISSRGSAKIPDAFPSRISIATVEDIFKTSSRKARNSIATLTRPRVEDILKTSSQKARNSIATLTPRVEDILKTSSEKARTSIATLTRPRVDNVVKTSSRKGFYYGVPERVLEREKQRDGEKTARRKGEGAGQTETIDPPSSPSIARIDRDRFEENLPYSPNDILQEMAKTLLEFKSTTAELRESISSIRKEMQILTDSLQRQFSFGTAREDRGPGTSSPEGRRLEFDEIAGEVERWAYNLFAEGVSTSGEGGDGEESWKEVTCNKMMRNKFNPTGKTKCFIKWMPDSRKKHNPLEATTYPCLKVYATIDAPLSDVCQYLSNPYHLEDYNDLVASHDEVESISSHSKICWSTSPQILFIKPRDFVTFCHLKWKKDGTQVVVNQAVDHPDRPGAAEERNGDVCRAHAIRGANFISKDPNDEGKTRFALLAHADPGGNLPPWAVKTAVNACLPIEPFKLMCKIEKGVKKMMEQPEYDPSSSSSSRPGGLSQMGYACFWPNGGGLQE